MSNFQQYSSIYIATHNLGGKRNIIIIISVIQMLLPLLVEMICVIAMVIMPAGLYMVKLP